MQKKNFNQIILFITVIILPFAVSKHFYNVNDLVKSSVLMLCGGFFLFIYYGVSLRRAFKEKTIYTGYAGTVDISVMLFLFILIISTVFSLRPYISIFGQYERQLGLLTYLILGLIYFAAGNYLHGKDNKHIFSAMEITAVLISLYAVLQVFKADPLSLQPSLVTRPVSTLGNAVFLGGFLILCIPFSVLNLPEKKNTYLKLLFPAAIAAGIIVTGTRSAYIAAGIQAIIFYFVYLRKKTLKNKNLRNRIIIFSVFALIIAAAFFIFYKDGYFIKRILQVFNFNNPRLILWQDSFKVFLNYPVTGCGVSMFPAALEDVYSMALRFTDAGSVHDHAHSNYIQILCTAGILGFLAYILMLFFFLKTSFLKSRKVAEDSAKNKHSVAVLLMISGYAFYGLTNFDDVSILFYLFIFLSLFRSIIVKPVKIKPGKTALAAWAAVSGIILILLVLNGYRTVKNLTADRNFLLANEYYERLDFAKGIEFNNKAILLNPDCSFYRYSECWSVYNYCFNSDNIRPEAKQKLLSQVETELKTAANNLYYPNYCKGLLSLVYYEQGRKEDGEKLKEEVLAKDSVNVNYRIRLGAYMLRENRLDEAYKNISVGLFLKPKELSLKLLAAVYFRKVNDRERALIYSRRVLQADPTNQTALGILRDYGEK